MNDMHAALAMAAAGLGVGGVTLARAGRRHRGHRGWPWWAAATGVGALGLLLAPWAEGRPWGTAAVQTLLMAWAPLTLLGVRHFHARLDLPGNARLDVAALAVAASASVWLPGPAVLAVHLYVAALLWSARTSEDTAALRTMGTVIALTALPPSLAPWIDLRAPLLVQATSAGFALLVVAFSTLTLMNERTESELRESRRRLRVLANTDHLTSVPNRRRFHELAARLLHGADGNDLPVLLVFDIDHFKLINDQLGHPAGDRALRLVGRCMRDALRAGDLAGRLGGDEFALLLPGATLAQAIGVAERVVAQLQAQSPEHRQPVLTLSFGLVQAQAGETVDAALHRADQALYEAKRQGRSRAVAATPTGDEDEPVFSESQRLGLTALR
jgi:diguanylate cyclase